MEVLMPHLFSFTVPTTVHVETWEIRHGSFQIRVSPRLGTCKYHHTPEVFGKVKYNCPCPYRTIRWMGEWK